MENKDILNVSVNLKRGEYVISRNNGSEIIKGKKTYDRKATEKRREEIKGNKSIPSEILRQIIPLLYDALEEFDTKYGTNYKTAYLEATTKQIPYTGVSEKERAYKKRVKGEREKMLEDSGIKIKYGEKSRGSTKTLPIGEKLRRKVKSLNIGEKVQTLSQESRQVFGFKKKTLRTIDNASAAKIFIQDDDILDIPDMPEGLETISSDILAEIGVTYDLNKQKEVEAAQPVIPTQVEDTAKPKESLKPVVAQPVKTKKTIKRCKRVQAAKNAEREAKKYKNLHKAKVIAEKQAEMEREIMKRKQEEQARIIREKEEQARIEREKKLVVRLTRTLKNQYDLIKNKIRVPDLSNQKKQLAGIMGAITIQAKIKSEKLNEKKEEVKGTSIRFARELKGRTDSIRNKVHMPNLTNQKRKIIGIRDSMALYAKQQAEAVRKKLNEKKEKVKGTSIRLTRELKDKTDSIRNKIHVPKIELNKRRIAGVVAGTTLILLFAVGSSSLGARTENLPADDEQGFSMATVETVEVSTNYSQTQSPKLDKKDVQKQDETQNVKAETKAKESVKDYLSSIKVGSTMKIENGRFYETPDGTGKSGDFGKYQEEVKEINMIGISTKDGYINIKDSDFNLYELKQQYPDGKFSFHIVCRNEDGSVRSLGWLTENSVEQTAHNNEKQVEDYER